MRREVLASCLVLGLAGAFAGEAPAQAGPSCFVGRDATGAPADLILQAECYGEFYEIYGRVTSRGVGMLQIKADGWSGAGRMFRHHEGEAGALYIQITDYTGAGLVLHVEGHGSFRFQAVPC